MKKSIVGVLIILLYQIVFSQTNLNLNKLDLLRNSSFNSLEKFNWIALDAQNNGSTQLSYITFSRENPEELFTYFYYPNDYENKYTRVLLSFRETNNSEVYFNDIMSFLDKDKLLKVKPITNGFKSIYTYNEDIVVIEHKKNNVDGEYDCFIWIYNYIDYFENIDK